MSLKAPVVSSKTIGPFQEIEFMGIVLDSVRMEARLPQDKLSRIHDLLNSFKSRRSVTWWSYNRSLEFSNLPVR